MEVNKFVGRLKTDFAQLRFREGRRFSFRAPRTIFLGPRLDAAPHGAKARSEDFAAADSGGLAAGLGGFAAAEQWKMTALHEVGHALLEHKIYTTDPERLRMESEAWEKAKELCEKYGVKYDTEYAEGELDSYREWLHRRSRCGECGLTRYQTKDGRYHCPGCDEDWARRTGESLI